MMKWRLWADLVWPIALVICAATYFPHRGSAETPSLSVRFEPEMIESDSFSLPMTSLSLDEYSVSQPAGRLGNWTVDVQGLVGDRSDTLTLTVAPGETIDLQSDQYLGWQFHAIRLADPAQSVLTSWSGFYLDGRGRSRMSSHQMHYEIDSTMWSVAAAFGRQTRRVATDVHTSIGLRYVQLSDQYDEYFGKALWVDEWVKTRNSMLAVQAAVQYVWQRDSVRMRAGLQAGGGPNWQLQTGLDFTSLARFEQEALTISTLIQSELAVDYALNPEVSLGLGLSGWYFGNMATARDSLGGPDAGGRDRGWLDSGSLGAGDEVRLVAFQAHAMRRF